MKYLEKFFTSIAWWTLRPDPNLLLNSRLEMTQRVTFPALRSEKGDLAVFYLPRGGS